MSEHGLLVGHPWVPRRKLDVVEYHRMAAAGILTGDDRVELIEGELVEMSPIGPLHASATTALAEALFGAARGRAVLGIGRPVRLDDHNEPEPDFILLKPRADRYSAVVARPTDVLLAIELSDSSLRFDRNIKLPLYGTHGIREYWIIDLAGGAVDVCRRPKPGGYEDVRRLGLDAVLEPEALPGLHVRLGEILR